MNFQMQSLVIDVSLHIGSLIAVVTFFYKDILGFLKNRQLFIKILISSIPVMVVGGFLVKTDLIEKIRNIEIIGWTTLIFGVLLYISDKFKLEKKLNEDFNYKAACIIGLFQILSLIPGVSRSGITITAGRFLGFKRFDASKISFLLSIPTLGAVSVYGLSVLVTEKNFDVLSLNYLSILFSFIFSYFTIKYFLKYINKFSMNLFVLYRLILGFTLLSITYL
tara:strand:+ start:33 stop:698 length:666 start_codon:yes stop_codon:yes gene_type:complete